MAQGALEHAATIGARPTRSVSSEPPPSVDGYEIEAELGRGGMGVVYRAVQTRLGRRVALKMILAGHSGDSLTRFLNEAHAVAILTHPNIVQIYEVGESGGRPFFSLEYVPGGSLEAFFEGKPQPWRNVAKLIATLARAMNAAHVVGIVHRDLKPANVLLASDGTPKITDFGIAKQLDAQRQTQTGEILGTPCYMAPEQALAKQELIDHRADIYALGAILYDGVTGRPPFLAESTLDTIMQSVTRDPVPLRALQVKVPRDLDVICLKCLEKDPNRRYQSALELAEDLERLLAGKPIQARPIGEFERVARWARRNPAWAALLTVSALAALLLVLGGLYSDRNLRRQLLATERARLAAKEAETALRVQLLRSKADAIDSDLKQLASVPKVELIRFPGHLPEPVSSRCPELGEAPKAVHG
jgi:serine/threonine protein kinase